MTNNDQWYGAATAGPEADAYAKQADDLIADALGCELEGSGLTPQTRILAGAAYALLSVGKRLEATEATMMAAARELTAVTSGTALEAAGELSDIRLGIENLDDTLGCVVTGIEDLVYQRRPWWARLAFWRRRVILDTSCEYVLADPSGATVGGAR